MSALKQTYLIRQAADKYPGLSIEKIEALWKDAESDIEQQRLNDPAKTQFLNKSENRIETVAEKFSELLGETSDDATIPDNETALVSKSLEDELSSLDNLVDIPKETDQDTPAPDAERSLEDLVDIELGDVPETETGSDVESDPETEAYLDELLN